ncbi:hypothetical protein FXN61_12175 [Lentzea sp. PSKA42]|uniref:Uncharacterized protein n=1 Tax=Lentzea indica TaxID=2604800 RepID=A0ABX1FFN7_9PSEU|nr:hypothetical protein [Lentzea indica]NKE57551.1 hypothetical protein [Lentzea indica]
MPLPCTSGAICTGLGVSAMVGQASVRVATGVAVDADGRHISLAAGGSAKLEDQTLVSVVDIGVVLPTAGLSGPLVVTIAWAETFDKAGFQANQTFLMMETPLLRIQRADAVADSGAEVVLAHLQVDGTGKVTALSAQRRRTAAIAVERVEFRAPSVTTTAGVTSVDHRVTAAVSVRPDGALTASTKFHVPQGIQLSDAVGLSAQSGVLAVSGPLNVPNGLMVRDSAGVGAVQAESAALRGVFGLSHAAFHPGVLGVNDNSGNQAGPGVWGKSRAAGVMGESETWFGVFGTSPNGTGAGADGATGFSGVGRKWIGVYGETHAPANVGSAGVWGDGLTTGDGVKGVAKGAGKAAVAAFHLGGGPAVFAQGMPAGVFNGDVEVRGRLTKSLLNFKIDHPVDPANRYLSHSAVESDEMKNVYDGVVVLDDAGAAVVELPSWFEALNTEFRYQLTAVGAAAPNLHVAEEVSGGRFSVAGGPARAKVCWLLTGVRHDAYARANPLQVETEKEGYERGNYLHPDAHGEPGERAIPFEVSTQTRADLPGEG